MMSELEIAFWQFHTDNPHVYAKLREIALDAFRRRGSRKWGIAALFERLRWLSEFETVGDLYKLNNNHRAFYARMLMKQEPILQGFFSVRESVAGPGDGNEYAVSRV